MQKILLVEDDEIVRKLYSESLSRHGFEVETASDGLAGITALGSFEPDLVILDLIMPRLSGEDVLRHMRGNDKTRDIPVIVFSNTYLSSLTSEATALGIDRAVLKSSCTAPMMAGIIQEVFRERASGGHRQEPDLSATGSTRSVGPKPGETAGRAAEDAEFRHQAHRHFVAESAQMLAVLLSAHARFLESYGGAQQTDAVKGMLASVHLIAGAAGPAGSAGISQLATVLEALLFQVSRNPARLSHSVNRTIAAGVETMSRLFKAAVQETECIGPEGSALVVDDDPIAAKIIAASLKEAGVRSDCTGDPFEGLEMLKRERYGLVVLDIEMPGMDGLEFCKRLRIINGYWDVPVIYVTAHSDFEMRARSILIGGTDLISKPIFPTEVAAKAVMQMVAPDKNL